MNDESNLNDILKRIQEVDNGINSMVVPMLKDTINDYKKTFTKMTIIIVLLILAICGIGFYSEYLISKQNEKYSEFLSQFEFESEVYQEVDNYSTITDGINISK